MARTLGPTGFRALTRPPDAKVTERLRVELLRLLAWQRSLRGWPSPRVGLDATPFVSLYAGGRIRGCFGSVEGKPKERLARAFLRALEDIRYGAIQEEARAALTAQLSYPLRPQELPPGALAASETPASFEIGSHGVAVALADGRASVVLPLVVREARLDAHKMIELALTKAGGSTADAVAARGWIFETSDVVARPGPRLPDEDPLRAAEAWLARLVDADGAVSFAVDPRSGARFPVGEAMHHGRAAVAIAALARRGRRALVARARARLVADVRAGLSGKAVPGWSGEPAVVAGTLALACLAGAPLNAELEAFARANRDALLARPWHAGQVTYALGARAETALFAACVRDLERAAWAPWTALAARALGRTDVLPRVEAALVAAIHRGPPHEGGAAVTGVPELALTAVAAEALAASTSVAARRAVARARSFLLRWQLVGDRLGGAYDVGAAHGAFPISPAFDALRCDVTGHALLALDAPAP